MDLWDAKVFPAVAPFWWIQKLVPLIVMVQSLPTLWAPNLLSKMICGSGNGEGGRELRRQWEMQTMTS
jgi:hypothetical protein